VHTVNYSEKASKELPPVSIGGDGASGFHFMGLALGGAKIGKIKAYRIGLLIMAVMLISLYFSSPSQVLVFYAQVFILGRWSREWGGKGFFSGVWASGQKLAYSVGPSIIGFALSLSGFTRGDVQPDSVAMGIRIVFCLFPALLLLLSFIPFNRYDLTEERFREIKQIIAGKS
jgi:Na+/melibiose symporter-like transporter